MMCLASYTFVIFSLMILAIAIPIDFSRWKVIFLQLFLTIFCFVMAYIIIPEEYSIGKLNMLYCFLVVVVLDVAMLLNFQILFNGSVFELYPEDFIFGAILMFADIMWVIIFSMWVSFKFNLHCFQHYFHGLFKGDWIRCRRVLILFWKNWRQVFLFDRKT